MLFLTVEYKPACEAIRNMNKAFLRRHPEAHTDRAGNHASPE